MSRIAYVNGRYLPHSKAATHVEDRGYQFADGVYEFIMIHNGRMIDGQDHLDRLSHSMSAIKLDWPMKRRSLETVIAEVIRRNRLRNGFLYLQITRGVARRNHSFPANAKPSLVMTAMRREIFANALDNQGVSVITMPDTRWKRCDIKSISLLPNVLSKSEAKAAGGFEAWLVDDQGFITEGASSNAWIVSNSGELLTRGDDQAILSGVTRQAVIKLAKGAGIALDERPFTVEEAKMASEAFLTSTSSFVKPVVNIDGLLIGDGRPGPISAKLALLYAGYVKQQGRCNND